MTQNQTKNGNQIQNHNQGIKAARSLDAGSYFHALIKEGCRLSLLSTSQLETIQFQLLGVLAEQFNRWTGGQSSSVPADTGQRIQQSVIYTIGCHLKGTPDPECALRELKSSTMEDLFLKGKQRLEKLRTEARKLLQIVQENRLDTDILAYNDTLTSGLPLFFSAYDMDYEAHGTPASIDYPLGNDKMSLTGIEYVHEYLQKLQLENEFCGYFSLEEINGLLRGYDRKYKELLFNVYDLVFTNAVGCLLLGRNEPKLNLSAFDRGYLQQELSSLSTVELDGEVDDAVSRLLRMLFILNPLLVRYIKATAPHLKSRLKHALEVNRLDLLFLSTEEDVAAASVQYEDRAPMEQEVFLQLADEIRDCRFLQDKIALLQAAPLSMTDLTDLLEGSCFFDEEYREVFSSLEEIRLALLLKKLPLDPTGSGFLKEESLQEWQSSLISFLEQVDSKRMSAILTLCDQIELGESRIGTE